MENNYDEKQEGIDDLSLYIKPELIESIIKTIAFYDLFDFPLMIEEIQEDLYEYSNPLHIKELRATLEYLVESEKLTHLKDYYIFPGRESTIETRKTRKFIAEKFWNRTKLYGQYMRAVPFVKMIAVCNNLAFDNSTEQSDIDLFIVVQSNRLWTARFIITLILMFYGVRRHGDKIAGRFCLSFFVTDQAMDMSVLQIKPEDPYLAYWMKNISPVYGEKTFEEFKQINSLWLKKYGLEFSEKQKRNMYFYQERKTKKLAEWVFRRKLGDFFEWLLKMTLKKMTLKNMKKSGSPHLIVTDEVLKFHNHDRRQEYYDRWKQTSSEILSSF